MYEINTCNYKEKLSKYNKTTAIKEKDPLHQEMHKKIHIKPIKTKKRNEGIMNH